MKSNTDTNTLTSLLKHVSIALGVILLLAITFFYVVLPFATRKGKVVTVPDLKGMTVDEASEFLKGTDLRFQVTDSSYNSSLAPLTVMEQYPSALSRVKIDRSIHLILNAKNPPTVEYPDLTSSSFEFAQKQLESLDLKIGEIHYTPDIAHNAVLESSVNGQSIRAGQRVSKGTVIDFVVGISKDSFPIPDFTRMPLDEVEAYLLGMNLTLQAIHYVEDATKDGKFIKKQLPSPGNIVRSGDKIELWVTRKD